MYYSFKGNIIAVKENYVVIEVHDVGYQIYVPHPKNYSIGKSVTILVYNVVREDEQYLAGFESEEEKLAFISLISVKGIGPRTALNALSATTSKDLLAAIGANNITFLKKLPGIGAKAASQIILDLKGQLAGGDGNPTQYDEVAEALKSLGFKNKEIENALISINEPNATNEEILRIALKKLKK